MSEQSSIIDTDEKTVKRINESSKKGSPLKAVNPIIRKYTEHRKGRIKNKLKFSRIIHTGRSKTGGDRTLKVLLPKPSPSEIPIVEAELLPCALNIIIETPEEVLALPQVQPIPEIKASEPECPTKESVNTPGKSAKSKGHGLQGSSAVKKKPQKYLKNIEATLALFESEESATSAKKEENYVEQYLLRVQNSLVGTNDKLYHDFLDLICEFQSKGTTVPDVFKTVSTMLSPYPDLVEDFIPFLTQDQALECGVFMEHLVATKLADFLTMLDIHFIKTPHHIKKVHSVLEGLSLKEHVQMDDVLSAVMPLLKGNPVLTDYFHQLLPEGRPPSNFLCDFEELEYVEGNSECEDVDEVEVVQIADVEDAYGGEMCPCSCHKQVDPTDQKYISKANHCVSCSTKYINGRVFRLSGKQLRPAKVVFHDHDLEYHRERLAPKNKVLVKRTRKRSSNSSSKENQSPSKSTNLSSDELRSDVEEERWARTGRNKSLSPKRRIKSGTAAAILPISQVVQEVKQEEKDEDKKEVTIEEEIKLEVKEEVTVEVKEEEEPWNIEEDRIILQTLQVEDNCDETFRKINLKIPSRSIEDIKKRFETLMTMLVAMKAKSGSCEQTI